MGFRNPIRVLDEATGPGGSQVETFHFAQATITAVYSPSGNALTLDPGDGRAPSLTLDYEDAPAGGKVPVARASAPWADLIPKTTLAGADYPNPTLFGPWGDTSGAYDDGWWRVDASGFVHLGGLVRIKTAGSWTAGVTSWFRLPVGARPPKQFLTDGMAQMSSYAILGFQIAADGNVFHVGNSPGWSYTANTWLSLDSFPPFRRAEQ